MYPASTAADQLIPIRQIARSLNLSAQTIAAMSKRGDFPKPFPLGVRKRFYLLSEVEKWWRERLGGANGKPFPLAPVQAGDDNPPAATD
jgi:predicted DNA-binding transcriptional regulator AlpA